MGIILLSIGSILSLVCAIMVLIQLFKKEGVGLGILGIFCGIYAYIWGWIKSKELNLKNVMLGWTAGMVLAGVGWVLFMKQVIENPEVQKAMQGPSAEFQKAMEKAMEDAKTKVEQGESAPTPP